MATEAAGVDLIKFRSIRETAEAFNLEPVILRYMQDNGLGRTTSELHAREAVRYLVIGALFPEVRWPMAGAADAFWHTFLIHTRRYSEFCDVIAGRFLHHDPVAEGSELGGGESEIYRDFLETYSILYGEDPPMEVWPQLDAPRMRVISCSFRVL